MLYKYTSNTNLHKLTITAILAAISSVLMFLSFSMPFFPPFLKFDFSELPALMATFILGPLFGVIVVLIKNIVNLFFTTTAGVGELANFIVGSSFVFTAGIIYKYKKTKKIAIISMAVATVIMTFFAAIVNYYILFPIYSLIIPIDSIIAMVSSLGVNIDSLFKIIIWVIVPFNLFKGTIISLITFFVYKKLSVLMKG